MDCQFQRFKKEMKHKEKVRIEHIFLIGIVIIFGLFTALALTSDQGSIILDEPINGSKFYIGDQVDFNGTINSTNFTSYQMYWNNSGWTDEGIILTDNGTEILFNSRIARFNSSVIDDEGVYDFRILLNDSNMNESDEVIVKLNFTEFKFDNIVIDHPENNTWHELGKLIIFNGTIKSDTLINYTVEWNDQGGWNDEGIELIDGGNDSVDNGTFAIFNSSVMEGYGKYNFRVVMNDNESRHQENISLFFIKEDLYEPDDNESQATALNLGERQIHTTYDNESFLDYDYFVINVTDHNESVYVFNLSALLIEEGGEVSISIDYGDNFSFSYDTKNSTKILHNFARNGEYYAYVYGISKAIYSINMDKINDSDGDGSPDRDDCADDNRSVLAPRDYLVIEDDAKFCKGNYSVENMIFGKDGISVDCDGSGLEGLASFLLNREDIMIENCKFKGMIPIINYGLFEIKGLKLKGNEFIDSLLMIERGEDVSIEENIFLSEDNNDTNLGGYVVIAHIENLTIKNNDLSMKSRLRVPRISIMESSEIEIYDNNISCNYSLTTEWPSHGIYIHESNMTTIKRNNITDCEDAGIEAEDSGNIIIEENDIQRGGNSISLEKAENIKIRENKMRYNEMSSIVLMYTDNVSIAKNIINTGQKYGIESSFDNNLSISGNELHDNDYSIIMFEDEGVELINNSIHDNIDSGVLIRESKQIIIYNNTVRDSNEGIYFIDVRNTTVINNNLFENMIGIKVYTSLTQEIIMFNNIYNNTQFDLFNDQTDELNTTMNYWGSDNSTEIQQKIFDKFIDPNKGKVYFEPFLEVKFENYTPPQPPEPLDISKIRVKSIKNDSAKLTWDTNKNSDSRAVYWINKSFELPYNNTNQTNDNTTINVTDIEINVTGNKTYIYDAELVKDHIIALANLTPNTIYNYIVNSTDTENFTDQSELKEFRTKPYCGDGDCNSWENKSSCKEDCKKTSTGGGSSGGGSSTSCDPLWDCGAWSDCADGKQTKDCYDINDCTLGTKKEERNCTVQEEPKIEPPVIDSDGDGVEDLIDPFPNDPNEWQDSDGDGTGNNADAYPYDPSRWEKSAVSETPSENITDHSEDGGFSIMWILLPLIFLVLLGGGGGYYYYSTIMVKPVKPGIDPAIISGLKNYVTSTKSKGFSLQQIRGVLIGRGWESSIVDRVLSMAGKPRLSYQQVYTFAYNSVRKGEKFEIIEGILKGQGFTEDMISKIFMTVYMNLRKGRR